MTTAEKMIKNVKTLTLEELKKEGDKAYADRQARDAALLEAFNNKKLKSKRLIKEAQFLKRIFKKNIKKEQAKATE
jgi:hypothetical protein